MFKDTVKSREELRAIFGAPMERAVLKERASLDVHSRAFIAGAPFVPIATAGAGGRCDVSPKGDAPGFVLVLDDHHLVVPDRPGNNRIDGLTNIVENPHNVVSAMNSGKCLGHLAAVRVLNAYK
jgi:predicted pyridoxine 5'-phosphate oxidase superfamily flavin-nucleotide-binding protein